LNVIDTLLLTHLVDGVVMVIRAEGTHYETIMKAKEKVLATKGMVIGAVIDNIPVEKKDIFYYYHHSPLPVKTKKKT
jgi:Mrp family chromosome partitioning ATPase